MLAVVITIALALSSYLIAPYAPTFAEPRGEYQPPSTRHLLGTDNLGRDIFSRLLWGASASVSVALISTVVATLIGTGVGMSAGMSGGHVDSIILRLLDIWLAFPGLLIALLLMSLWGREGKVAGIVVGFSFAPIIARLVRSATRHLKVEDYVTASSALGADTWWITQRHIVRNLASQISTNAALVFAWSMLSVTGLEFLGLIGEASSTSWGQMINEGRAYLLAAPVNVAAPGMCLTLIVWMALSVADIESV